jgi:histidinol-phosphate aminotransferase
MSNRYFRADICGMPGYEPGEQPRGGKFIKLNTNENPYPPSPAVQRAINAMLEQGLQKYPDPWSSAFCIRAGEVLGVDPDWILCGNGSDDILTIVTRAFVGQGQRVRYPMPSYVLYRTLAQIQGADVDEVRFEPDWSLGDAFTADSANLRLAFLANPNSPSGTQLAPQRVLQLAEQLPCPLLVDEAYVDFAESNCLELVTENEKILVSRSLSKSYALAGLRFGFLVAQPQMIQQLGKVKDSYNCDALAVAGAVAAIDDQEWLAKNRERILQTRQRVTQALREFGFDVVPSQANFVWCTHPQHPAADLAEELRKSNILVRYMEYDGYEAGLRISVGTEAQMDACLGVLRSVTMT